MLREARLFGPLGLPEVLIILVLALLLFGPKRLPEIGRTIGRGLGEFRRASNDLRRTLEAEISLEEQPPRPTPVKPTPPAAAAPPDAEPEDRH
jgi:sec-independent protein translocase protein TatA